MDKDVGTEAAIRRWDRHAEKFSEGFDEQGDLHREVFLNPTLFDLMGAVDNKKILDAGCGNGYLSRMIANQGGSVAAVDYSKQMLTIAKRNTNSELDIHYHHGNCESLDFLPNRSFDIIISNMVIQDLANYRQAFKEMHRLLKDEGAFIFSILHPCFITPNSGWVKTDTGEKLYWKVDNYFYEGTYEQAIPVDQEEKILYFHRTLTSYIEALTETGFILERLVEPKPSEEILVNHPSFREDFRCADFMVFKLRKNKFD
ncbi:ubiquinone/menaquinone biosynthesis C-methylase UbiE [Bacillus pakistanensis]|uniref:Ubiquinone/menaquinone biosynthesis C-methylase UbiE n=1 Tax=Rossellomorea pakistanensis TaxID=992288 RepID=A0ABS2N785_9BACI|nr:class I SAM-dependent methyltransferase [Bacillus pakistanensis]MBM7583703.1 ubiquinone/menaquinone biosynthesis C-methylase UbiE [Bacillus pakistanensis]